MVYSVLYKLLNLPFVRNFRKTLENETLQLGSYWCCSRSWPRLGIQLRTSSPWTAHVIESMELWCIPVSEEPKEPRTCNLNELVLPENALGWICSENSFYSNDLILKSGKCSIDCDEGYIATSGIGSVTSGKCLIFIKIPDESNINVERMDGSTKTVSCSDAPSTVSSILYP